MNSLHGQAIDRPGGRVIIEGLAEDGTPEAISLRESTGFALGVQWHAEWEPWDDPVNGPSGALLARRSKRGAAAGRIGSLRASTLDALT